MEIELKYTLSKEKAKEIFAELREKLSDEKDIPMHAIYYDTPDRALRKLRVAVRIRREGEKLVATCKWGGGSKDGLHKREEVNIALPIDYFPESVNRGLFAGSPAYDVIGTDESFEKLLEMEFVRKEYRLDTGKSISLISFDEGEIKVKSKEMQISELEIEFLQGSEDNLLEIGQKLVQKHKIVPCNTSKLARGLQICEE